MFRKSPCTGSRYRRSWNRKLQHLWPQESYVRNSGPCFHVFEHHLLDGNKIKMILRCLLPEVQIWRLSNRKPLHWWHSVGVSPVQLRTHWAIELVVGTLNLEKGRKLLYSFHFRSFTYFRVFAFTSLPYWFLPRCSMQPVFPIAKVSVCPSVCLSQRELWQNEST